MNEKGLIYSLLMRPVTVVMITLLVIGFGLFSLTNLKITLFPSVDIPVVAVSMNYRSVSPEDMQRIIVEPIENALASIDGVVTMDSNIRKGGAFMVMRLKPGTNAMRVELDAREAIDRIRNSLPQEASPPIIFQFDPERQPIMNLSIQASNRGLDELRNLSTEIVEPLLERINGVAQADTRGGLQRAIYVEINPEKMAQHRITTAEIEQSLTSNNVQVPAGNLSVGRESYSIRAESIFSTIEEIGNTIIRMENGTTPLRVRDVAEVRDHFVDINTIVEVNGKNSVTIEIQKQSDANTLDVALAVIDMIPEIEERLPAGVTINVINNQGQFIENSINNLAQSAIFALILVALILLIFMGSYRAATVVALSIPISMTATFAAMYFTGVSLNIISITGLALAVGLLVDNSIVVLDNIIAKLEEGADIFTAVLKGTNEVKGALMGATLTTLGVFIPIFFLDGFIGQIARDLAYTITFSITFSYIASIILIPVFSSKLLKHDSIVRDGLMFRMVGYIEKAYERSFRWVMVHKWIMFLIVGAIFYGIYFFNSSIPGENMPEGDSGELIVSVDMPSGTNLVNTAEIIKEISDRLMRDDRVKTIITSIGRSGFRTETNTGRITVTLVPESQRSQSTDDFALELRRQLVFPGVRTFVRVSSGGGFGGGGGGWGGGMGSIRVSLIGPDTQILQGMTTRIEEVMLQDSTVISVDNPAVDEVPELVYRIDREVLNRMGSSFSEVANSFKTQTRGTLVGQFRSGGREYPIEVRMSEDFRTAGIEDLNRMQVTRFEDQSIPVVAVGYFEPVLGLNRIQRRDRETLMDVNIRVAGDASAQRQRIIELFENEIVMPEGYRYEFTGASRDQQDASRQLFMALLAAIALTFMVMAGKFENLRDPFVIMFSIPLAFFGAYFMLYVTGTSFSSPAGIGMLILVGIVVNNGIVLIDYINQSTRQASTAVAYFEQLVQASKRRVRPILLTMLTTVFSMIPLAIGLGEGSETWSPLARVVIGGLFFSSIFTLYIIPVVHIGISGRKRRIVKAANLSLKNNPT
jgi:HAE1 family hydrophobic/amphiphilic exporter-1